MKSDNFNIFQLLTPKSSVHFFVEGLSITDALEKFEYHKYSVVPVLNKNGEYINTISEGDLLRFIRSQQRYDEALFSEINIEDINRYRTYQSISISASFEEIFELVLSQNFVPVVDDRNMFIGIIRRKDILYYVDEQGK